MLLQSLRALCFAPGGPGSIWNYLGAPVMSTGVSGRFACGFRTNLHFADVGVGSGKPMLPERISSLPPSAECDWSLITYAMPVQPVSAYHCIFPPELITI